MIYAPGVEPAVYGGLTSAVDIMPTVLEIMGQDIPVSVHGESLLARMKDTGLPGREYVISAQPFSKPGQITRQVDGRERKMSVESSTTITTDEWALLYSTDPGESWLYHLPTDPHQERNVAQEHQDVAKQLHQHLVSFMQQFGVSAELQDARKELIL